MQDTADRLADIRRLVQTLDIPVRQVLIEARIVIVNDDFSRELGVRFGGAVVGNYGSNDGLMYVGHAASTRPTGDSRPDHRHRRHRRHAGVDGYRCDAGRQRSLQRQPAGRQPGRHARA